MILFILYKQIILLIHYVVKIYSHSQSKCVDNLSESKMVLTTLTRHLSHCITSRLLHHIVAAPVLPLVHHICYFKFLKKN